MKKCDIANIADDTTPYTCGTDTQSVIAELHITANKPLHWFEYNHLKANPCKSHLGEVLLTTSTTETLLGIKINSEISFDQYVSSICSKASKKLHARKSSKISLF